MRQKQYAGKVLTGNKIGRTLGFPTVNLDPSILPLTVKKGVYTSIVQVKDTTYLGALFFGPRVVLGETHTVLEIYLLDFNQNIYGETVAFRIGPYIRGVENFDSVNALKKQLQKDVEKVRITTQELSVVSPAATLQT